MSHRKQTTIIAASDVSQGFVKRSIEEVGSIPSIDTVTVQDLLLSRHRRLFAEAKYIAANSGQVWQFVDNMEISQFSTWQNNRNLMMIRRPVPQPGLHAEVTIPEGTPLVDILQVLMVLQQDAYVYNVSFSGALLGYHETMVPQEFCDLVDYKLQTLDDEVVLSVSCGRPCQSWANNVEWKDILQECCILLESLMLLSHVSSSNRRVANQKPKKSGGHIQGEMDPQRMVSMLKHFSHEDPKLADAFWKALRHMPSHPSRASTTVPKAA